MTAVVSHECKPRDDLATIGAEEAARLLGINKQRLYQLTRRGVIPCIRLGRAIRYRVSTLRAWMESQERKSQGRE